MSKTAPKPRDPRYPEELLTLTDHILKRRLDLGLTQKETAKLIKVDKCTVWNWENNQSEPFIQHYPAIMDFLGYCPYVRPTTWGERLHLYRIHKGLTCRELAKIIPADPTSIRRWEKMQKPPYKIYREKAEAFMEQY